MSSRIFYSLDKRPVPYEAVVPGCVKLNVSKKNPIGVKNVFVVSGKDNVLSAKRP